MENAGESRVEEALHRLAVGFSFDGVAKAAPTNAQTDFISALRTQPMFENDPGDISVRGTVHGWRVYRAHGTPVPIAVSSTDDDQ